MSNPDDKQHPENLNPSEVYTRLNDGVDYRILQPDGTARTIRIKLVSLRNTALLAAAWMREADEIELYTGLTTKEVNELNDADWAAIVNEGRTLNFPRLDSYLTRQMAWIERQEAARKLVEQTKQPAK